MDHDGNKEIEVNYFSTPSELISSIKNHTDNYLQLLRVANYMKSILRNHILSHKIKIIRSRNESSFLKSHMCRPVPSIWYCYIVACYNCGWTFSCSAGIGTAGALERCIDMFSRIPVNCQEALTLKIVYDIHNL
jgi:hypothetical protein